MPDNNGDQPTNINAKNINASGIRTESLNANTETVQNMTVTRMNVMTGEEKDASTDVINELRISNDRNNRTIIDLLAKNLKKINAGSDDIGKLSNAISSAINDLTRETEIGLMRATSTTSAMSDDAMRRVETSIENLTRNLSQTLSSAESERGMIMSQTIGDVTASVRMVQSASQYVSDIFSRIEHSRSISPELMGNRQPYGQRDVAMAQLQRLTDLQSNLVNASAQEQQKLIREFNALSTTINRTTKSAAFMYRLLTSENNALANIVGRGILSKFEGNMLSTIHTLQNWTSNLVDISKVSRGGAEHLKSSLDMAATGAIGVNTALFEFIPALTQGADSLTSTFAMVKYALASDLINPIGIMGSDLREVSRSMRVARTTLLGQGNSAISRMSTSASNEAILGLFDLQRRINIRSDINDSRTLSMLGSQLNSMQIIATNTGTTVDEIVKMNSNIGKQLFNAASAGILSGKQATTYMNAQALLQQRGLTEMAGMIRGLAESGGSAALYLNKNQDMAASLSASGTIGALYQLEALLNSTTQTNAAFFAQLQNVASGFKSQTQLGAAGSVVLTQAYQNLSGEAGRAADITSKPPEVSFIQRVMVGISDIMTNYIGTTTGLIVSLGANTAAVIANTFALGGFGKIGKLLTGIGGGILRIPKKMMGIFRGGAAAAGAAAGSSVGSSVAATIGPTVAASTESAISRIIPSITKIITRTPTIIRVGTAGAVAASTGILRGAGNAVSSGVKAVGSIIPRTGSRAVSSGVKSVGSIIPRTGSRAVSSGVKAVGSIIPESGAIVGASRGLGTMISRSLPVIGTLMGIYDAVSRISNGDVLGGLWSGAAGIMASINPLVSAGMYAGLVGRDAYNSYSSSTTTTAAPIGGYTGQDPLALAYPLDLGGQYTSDATVNSGIRNDTQQLIWATNQALYDLISIAQNEVSILRVIANNTSNGQTEVPVGFFDWLTGTAKKEREKASAKNAATYSPPREMAKPK